MSYTRLLTVLQLYVSVCRYARAVDHLAVGTLSRVHHLEMDCGLQNSDYASGMTAWVHISTASESAPTLSACYAASVNPWTETIWDNVSH
jgi:hypothetical protein